LVLLLIYFNQRSMMYHPHGQTNPLSYYSIDNTEEVTLTTIDGVKLQAWFRPADKNHDMVVFLHGNGGNLENRVEHLKQLSEMGYGFIIPAWRSFGKSEGKPTMDGLFLDARAAIKFIQAQGYSLLNTIMIGESLGTGVATQMALENKFKGLFLITPYTSIADRADEIYPFMFARYLTKDNFKVLDNIASIKHPVLIIHGDQDNIVPQTHSEKIFAAANEPKRFITYPGVNHINYDKKEVFWEMNNFFASDN
jgi:uncharacterized protein